MAYKIPEEFNDPKMQKPLAPHLAVVVAFFLVDAEDEGNITTIHMALRKTNEAGSIDHATDKALRAILDANPRLRIPTAVEMNAFFQDLARDMQEMQAVRSMLANVGAMAADAAIPVHPQDDPRGN